MENLSDFFIDLDFKEKNKFSDQFARYSVFDNESFRISLKYYFSEGATELSLFDHTGESKAVFFSERLLREFVLIKKHEYEECGFLNFMQELEKITNAKRLYNSHGFVNDFMLKSKDNETTFLRILPKPNFLLNITLSRYRINNRYPPPVNIISSKDNSLLSELKSRIVNYLVNSDINAFEGFLYEKGVNISIYP